MKLLRSIAAHPVSVLMVYSALALFAAVSVPRLKVELLPRLRIPAVRVVTELASMPAEEMEQLVTVPVESALSSVQGVRAMSSITRRGLSCVELRFDWNANLDRAAVEIREKVDSAYPYLPHGAEKPVVVTEDLADEPVLRLAVLPAPGVSFEEASALARRELRSRLQQIPAAGAVRMVGAVEPEIQVEVDAGRLYAAGMSLAEVLQGVSGAVFEYPVGRIREGPLEYAVKARTDVDSLEALRRLPLAAGEGGGLRLADVAEVRIGSRQPTSLFHAGGQQAVGMLVHRSAQTGTLEASRELRRRLRSLQVLFAREVRIWVIEDAAAEIRISLDALALAAAAGTGMAALVLFLFLRRLRAVLVVVASVPASLAATALFLRAAQVSLNLISVCGVAIGVGMILDNSIVVMENLVRRGAATPVAVAAATSEMAAPALASTLTTLLVFLPVVFVPGVVGVLFRDLALTVSFLLACSFLTAMTLTPALYRLLGAGGARAARPRAARSRAGRRPAGTGPHPVSQDPAGREASAEGIYRSVLWRLLGHPWIAVVAAAALCALGAASLGALKGEILPWAGARSVNLRTDLPPGSSPEQAAEAMKLLASILKRSPAVAEVCSEAGYDADRPQDRGQSGTDLANLRTTVLFDSARRRPESLVQALPAMLRSRLEPSRQPLQRLLGSQGSPRLVLTGTDREALVERARAIVEETVGLGLARSAEIDTRRDAPEIRLTVDRDSLARAGVSARLLLEEMETAVRGRVAARLHPQEEGTDIRVRIRRRPGDSFAAGLLLDLRVRTANGHVRLGSLAAVSRTSGYGELFRRERSAAVGITLHPAAGSVAQLQRHLAGLVGENAFSESGNELRRSRSELLLAFLLAAALIYVLLGAQFESLTLPMLVVLASALSLAPAGAGMWALGRSLNVSSFLGLLILFGTTVNTAILLAAAYRGDRANPADLLEASAGRLRPAAAAACTTVGALLPLTAAGFASGALQSHTALPVLIGLAAGTPLTLLLFPPLALLTNRRRGPRL